MALVQITTAKHADTLKQNKSVPRALVSGDEDLHSSLAVSVVSRDLWYSWLGSGSEERSV